MKLFSIKRLIGLGAIYAAVQYARKNGGARNAFSELLDKAKGTFAGAKDLVDGTSETASGKAGFATGSGPFASDDRIGAETEQPNGSSNGRRSY